MIVLVVLRHDRRAADLGGGNGIAATTIRRWTDEVVALLAAGAPHPGRALAKVARRGGEAVLIDGTLIPTRRRTGRDNRFAHLKTWRILTGLRTSPARATDLLRPARPDEPRTRPPDRR
ncbi:hypothetical protein ACH4ZU_09160 [Streptomyces sp. NPDC020472]|uniref:hypothetical protein n=1 Tax=Streptomyces sp. NPDC020472 TaxID=3365075 RepID=UPI0037A3382A